MPRRWLVFWAVLLFLGTLHPFEIDPDAVTVPSETFWLPRLKGLDPPFNVVLFLPVGLVMRACGKGWRWAIGLGFAFSLVVELSQHFIAFRVPVAEDLVFNTLGAGLGWRLSAGLQPVLVFLQRPWFRIALFGAVTAFIGWSAAPPVVSGRLWFWECDAELVVGRERPGNYRWPGTVHRAQLTATALVPEAPGQTADWSWPEDGEGPRAELCRTMRARQAFTLTVRLTAPPKDASPQVRRIVTWSGGVQRRNLMLAQKQDTMLFRVWTRVTPIVGRFPDKQEPLVMPALEPGRTATVTVVYDHGRLTGYIDGAAAAEGRLGDLPKNNGVRTFWLPRHAGGTMLYGFSAGLVWMAVVMGFLLRRYAALVAGLGVIALEIGQMLMFSRGPDGLGLVAGGLGIAVSAWACAPPARPTGARPAERESLAAAAE